MWLRCTIARQTAAPVDVSGTVYTFVPYRHGDQIVCLADVPNDADAAFLLLTSRLAGAYEPWHAPGPDLEGVTMALSRLESTGEIMDLQTVCNYRATVPEAVYLPKPVADMTDAECRAFCAAFNTAPQPTEPPAPAKPPTSIAATKSPASPTDLDAMSLADLRNYAKVIGAPKLPASITADRARAHLRSFQLSQHDDDSATLTAANPPPVTAPTADDPPAADPSAAPGATESTAAP